MGNTPAEENLFAEFLRGELRSRGLRIADLARQIARNEGIDESDEEDFNRRTKSIHNNISNALNGVSNFGEVYIRKIADALGIPHESALRIAGKLIDDPEAVVVIPATTRGKIEALLASLPEEQQAEAIRFLESYVMSQVREQLTPKPAPKQKMKKA